MTRTDIAVEWAHHGHPEIPKFLNAIKSLTESGVSMEAIRENPNIVDELEHFQNAKETEKRYKL